LVGTRPPLDEPLEEPLDDPLDEPELPPEELPELLPELPPELPPDPPPLPDPAPSVPASETMVVTPPQAQSATREITRSEELRIGGLRTEQQAYQR
jgi:hypothetical protein